MLTVQLNVHVGKENENTEDKVVKTKKRQKKSPEKTRRTSPKKKVATKQAVKARRKLNLAIEGMLILITYIV